MNKLEKELYELCKSPYRETILLKYKGLCVATLTITNPFIKDFKERKELLSLLDIQCNGLNKETGKREYILSYRGINILVDDWGGI